jgi:hypothetical protein
LPSVGRVHGPIQKGRSGGSQVDDRLWDWDPSGEELEEILAEMRPIIQEFVRRDRSVLARPAARAG